MSTADLYPSGDELFQVILWHLKIWQIGLRKLQQQEAAALLSCGAQKKCFCAEASDFARFGATTRHQRWAADCCARLANPHVVHRGSPEPAASFMFPPKSRITKRSFPRPSMSSSGEQRSKLLAIQDDRPAQRIWIRTPCLRLQRTPWCTSSNDCRASQELATLLPASEKEGAYSS